MINVSPPVLNGFVPDDKALRITTVVFGSAWPGTYRPLLYAHNRWELSNDRDSLTGVIYPTSRLREDSRGRLVADSARSVDDFSSYPLIGEGE